MTCVHLVDIVPVVLFTEGIVAVLTGLDTTAVLIWLVRVAVRGYAI
jgi:hypothetical protein